MSFILIVINHCYRQNLRILISRFVCVSQREEEENHIVSPCCIWLNIKHLYFFPITDLLLSDCFSRPARYPRFVIALVLLLFHLKITK